MAQPHDPVHIYEHDDKGTTLLPHLASHLPLSSALLRRIQHGIAYPAPTAKILVTFPQSASPSPDRPWLAARVDLFRGRETQIIIYSSLEAEHTSIQPIGSAPAPLDGCPCPSPGPPEAEREVENNHASPGPNHVVATLHTASPAFLDLARAQLLALLSYVKANLLPGYLASLPADYGQPAATQSPNGVPLIPAPDPKAFLIGTLHTGLFTLLLESGVFPDPDADAVDASSPVLLPGLKVHRYDNPPYVKYFFSRDAFTVQDGAEIPLPDEYRYHDRKGRVGVLNEHLELVQSRTSIPRSKAQLSTMPGVAIYCDESAGSGDEDEMPIAWAFLGLDGPLATLHVEPEHRGKGLALCLSKETMRRGMDPNGVFGADKLEFMDEKLRQKTTAWVHTEVAQVNKASRRVMEKVGGEVLTTVMWVVIELCD
ncbi:Acyl-CoA N-acyltransferase [Penicillium lividum]|nr:Acyl-CoA N-acyltransferase [Penicillium lividum]